MYAVVNIRGVWLKVTVCWKRSFRDFMLTIWLSVENLEHCDFIALRNIVIRTHLQDLKDVTNNVHYENYRCRKLAGLGVDGKQSRLSNK